MPTQSDTEDSLFPFTSHLELKKHLKKIISLAHYELAIFSHALEAPYFSDDDIVRDLSSLVRTSSRANVRIVVSEPQQLVDNNHKILALSQRLVSKVHIQKMIIEAHNPFEFVIADKDKLWLRHDREGCSGFANYAARPEVKRFSTTFEEYWKYSEPDVRLRRLQL